MTTDPESSWILRQATPSDVPALASIYAAAEGAVRATVPGARPLDSPHEKLAAWMARRLAACGSEARLLVAETARDPRVVGMVETGPGELRALYVLPELWGSGVAAVLHEAALAQLAAGGAREAVLSVIAANGRARRFYERLGWRLERELDRLVGGVSLPFACYRRELAG